MEARGKEIEMRVERRHGIVKEIIFVIGKRNIALLKPF